MYTISKKTAYGLQALLELGRRYNHGPVLIAELARQHRMPKKFLELILLELRKAGLLGSRTGKGGGYVLLKPPETITLADIFRSLEGPLMPGRDAREEEGRCGIHPVMQELRDAAAATFQRESLADLLRRDALRQQQRRHILVYSI